MGEVSFIAIYEGGWVYLYSFILLSTGAINWESSCFATTVLQNAPPKVTSVLVYLPSLEVYVNWLVYR